MILIIVISLAIHSAFYVIIFSRLAIYKERSNTSKNIKTSIVICYKNEETNIKKFLPSILEQKFDELILIDDNSSDDTFIKLNVHKSNRIRVISNQKKNDWEKERCKYWISKCKERYNIID